MQSGQKNESKLHKLRGNFRNLFGKKKSEETDLEISARLIDEMESALSFEHKYEDGHIPKEEWPDGGDAEKWGVKLSQADGVTVLLVLENHLDTSSVVASIQGVEEFLAADPDLKQKTAICNELSYLDPGANPSEINYLADNLANRDYIFSALRDADIEPETIRGVFSKMHPENRAIYNRFMQMIGVNARYDAAKMIDPEVSPDIELFAYEDPNMVKEYVRVVESENMSTQHLEKDKIRLVNDRNFASALNLADYVRDKGKKLIVVVAGCGHYSDIEKTNLKQDIIDEMERAGLPCNVVTIRTSREEPTKSNLDCEFEFVHKSVDKVLYNTLIKRGTRPTDDEVLVIGNKYSGKDGKELYDQSMRVLARQEAKKGPSERRRGASNDYTIAAAKYEAQAVLGAKKDIYEIYEKQKEAYVNLCANYALNEDRFSNLIHKGKGSSLEGNNLSNSISRAAKLLIDFEKDILSHHSDELNSAYQSCKNKTKIKNTEEYIASRIEFLDMEKRNAPLKDMRKLRKKIEAYHDSVNKAHRKSKSSGMSL